MFSPVVGPGDGIKLLLARGVPQHQPHRGAVVGSDHLLQEVDPDGFLVRWCEHSLAVSPDQTRLSNTSVSNNHNLITKNKTVRKDGIKKKLDQFTRGKNGAINSYEKSAQFRHCNCPSRGQLLFWDNYSKNNVVYISHTQHAAEGGKLWSN